MIFLAFIATVIFGLAASLFSPLLGIYDAGTVVAIAIMGSFILYTIRGKDR